MEISTLKTKKAIHKGKIKKTLKNVLCRPDPSFWPILTDEHKISLEKVLCQYKVDIPQFQKPHWKELKLIPKEKRPKPPKIKKVEGLLFGITECCNAVKSNQCAAVIVEAGVNPRIIVQPLIEACVNARIPVLCVNDFRATCNTNFGIPTSCLGVKNGCLSELQMHLLEIAKNHKLPTKAPTTTVVEPQETFNRIEEPDSNKNETTLKCPYLYRTTKKTRVFIPPASPNNVVLKNSKDFSGQDFVGISEKSDIVNRNSYMKMIVKKISSNPNRLKVKK